MAVSRTVHSPQRGHGGRRGRLAAVVVAVLVAGLLPMLASTPAAAAPANPNGPWTRVAGKPAAAKGGHRADVRAKRVAAHTLDRAALTSTLAKVPTERARRQRAAAPLVVSLPTPAGDFQRFELADSPVMEAGLAAKHPEIRTYAGKGIDDQTATIRADLTPLGFHASVRSPHGAWYIDPYYNQDQSLYASYYGRDLADSHGEFVEREDVETAAQALEDEVAALAGAPVSLRTYRLALVTDPSYATFFGADNIDRREGHADEPGDAGLRGRDRHPPGADQRHRQDQPRHRRRWPPSPTGRAAPRPASRRPSWPGAPAARSTATGSCSASSSARATTTSGTSASASTVAVWRASASSAATARRVAAPACPPRSVTSTPSTTSRTRWATSSAATTRSTAPS